jgi:putative tryptophan/tyrosine transport system substrate-binding protein
MSRSRALHLAWLLACASAPLPAQAGPSPETERVIAYVDADTPRVKASIVKFDAALQRRGIKARHNISIRHVPVDVFKRDEAAANVGAALRDRPALVIATSSESAAVARELTSEIPIVFGSQQDPVRLGLVSSLAGPGGNLTGFTVFVPVDLKRIELLREIAPHARRLGIVIDHWWMEETDGARILREAKADLGFDGRVFLVEKPEDLRLLASRAAREIDAWYVPPTTLPYEHPAALLSALAALRKPVVFPTGAFTEAGGLAAYQPMMSLDEAVDQFAKIVGLVLDGVPTGNIPVERPKSFQLSVNAAEARRLGIALPDALLKRADRVIDDKGAALPR